MRLWINQLINGIPLRSVGLLIFFFIHLIYCKKLAELPAHKKNPNFPNSTFDIIINNIHLINFLWTLCGYWWYSKTSPYRFLHKSWLIYLAPKIFMHTLMLIRFYIFFYKNWNMDNFCVEKWVPSLGNVRNVWLKILKFSWAT